MNDTTRTDESGSVDEKRAQYEDFSLTVVKGGVGYVNVRNDIYGDEKNDHIYSVEVDNGEAVGCSCLHHVHRGAHCKHQVAVENTPIVLAAAKGRDNTAVLTDGGETDDSETDDSLRGSSDEPPQDDETVVSSELPRITRHVEAPEYGGETYARCEGCGVESIGGPDHILHDDNCPHANDSSRASKDYSHVEDNGRTETADFGGGESTRIDVL